MRFIVRLVEATECLLQKNRKLQTFFEIFFDIKIPTTCEVVWWKPHENEIHCVHKRNDSLLYFNEFLISELTHSYWTPFKLFCFCWHKNRTVRSLRQAALRGEKRLFNVATELALCVLWSFAINICIILTREHTQLLVLYFANNGSIGKYWNYSSRNIFFRETRANIFRYVIHKKN